MDKAIRSLPEKRLLCQIVKKTTQLPFPLEVRTDDRFEDERCYVIPDDKKLDVLLKLWPFTDTPTADQVFFDLHAQKLVRFGDCLVIRYKGRDLLVSPLYFEAGGCSIDLMDPATSEESLTSIRQLK